MAPGGFLSARLITSAQLSLTLFQSKEQFTAHWKSGHKGAC